MRVASVVLDKVNSFRVLIQPAVAILLISGWFQLSHPPVYGNTVLMRLTRITFECSAAFLDAYILMWACAGSVVLIGQLRNKDVGPTN